MVFLFLMLFESSCCNKEHYDREVCHGLLINLFILFIEDHAILNSKLSFILFGELDVFTTIKSAVSILYIASNTFLML